MFSLFPVHRKLTCKKFIFSSSQVKKKLIFVRDPYNAINFLTKIMKKKSISHYIMMCSHDIHVNIFKILALPYVSVKSTILTNTSRRNQR